MYTYKTHIRFSEVDIDLHLTLPALMTEFQDCSIFHANAIGQATGNLRQEGHLWLLSSWQIIIDRYPSLYEEVELGTWAYGWRNFFGYRNFTMKDSDGKLTAYASTNWVYTDLATGHPARVPEEVRDLYGTEPPLDMEVAPRKIALPEGGKSLDAIPITKSDIDANGHVNNARYVAIAQELIPDGFATRQLRAEYRTAAKFGHVFYPTIWTVDDSGRTRIIVALRDHEQKTYAVVEFTGS
ncbi:MAG: acyl-[acyl-carrier-protein] thioesterase [Lachnospiraceae bacterium]|nr:acyl-[acyl-carrier-protein] thioesterase [Lachnospiraceae bacterium]